jgi:hypothetical protein
MMQSESGNTRELKAAELLFNRDRKIQASSNYSRLIKNSEKTTMYR